MSSHLSEFRIAREPEKKWIVEYILLKQFSSFLKKLIHVEQMNEREKRETGKKKFS